MRTILNSFIILAMLTSALNVQAQYAWALSEGGNGLDVGKAVRFDQSGNVIVCGDIAGNPVFGGVLQTGNGLSDGFVAKYNSDGQLQWFRLVGGIGVDKCTAVALDAADNIYVCGYFEDTMRVGNYGVRSKGASDIYVCKFNASGEVQWLKSYGGVTSDLAFSIAVNNNGEPFVCGTFGVSIQFGNTTLTAASPVQSFIVKLKSDGNTDWAIKPVSSNNHTTNSLTLLPNGNLAVAGYYSLALEINGVSVQSSSANYDIFLCSMQQNGTVNWLKKAGGSYDDVSAALSNDAQGNLFLCGNISGFASFDDVHLSNAGYTDPFIAKYDSNGNCLWARSGEGLDLDLANGIACDIQGNVYATGMYENSITFSGQTISGYDQRQLFMVSYDTQGNLRWVKDAGGSGTDCGMAINADGSGNVYLTGYYTYLAQFDGITLPAAGLQDVFLAKYRQSVSGISEHEKVSVSVYPNPVSSSFTVQGNIPENAVITLFDAVGRKVTEQSATNKTVSVSRLPAGVYTLVLFEQERLIGTGKITLGQ